MFSTSFRNFLRDESGAYTVWSLVWFSLYVAIGGLAVDMTDAYRNQTLLQSTADSAALAGAISLPDATDAVTQAVSYSTDNMYTGVNGIVLDPTDVIVGHWNPTTRAFGTGATPPDAFEAVFVTTRRADANSNPLALNFLRIVSLFGIPFDRWNINTEAIAVKYIWNCVKKNGLIAANQLDLTSNNTITGTCNHAENFVFDNSEHNYAVDMGNHNTFIKPVAVSMPDLDDLNNRSNLCEKNFGLCDDDVLSEGHHFPADVLIIDQIIAGVAAGTAKYLIPGLYDATGPGDPIPPTPISTVDGTPSGTPLDEKFAGPYEKYKIYNVNCSSDKKTLNLPTTTPITNVAIVTNCIIKSNSGLALSDAILASTSLGNGAKPTLQHSIDFASNATYGNGTFCDPDSDGSGQVHLYTPASAKAAAGVNSTGLRAVVGGDFQLSAGNGIAGVSVQAGNNISVTANSSFSGCGGEFDGEFTFRYRLVH